MNIDQNHIDDLISRSLAGESSAEEENQLATWIAQRDENKLHYQKTNRAFDLSGNYFTTKISKEPNLNIDQEWNHFLKHIDLKQTGNIRSMSSERNPIQLWLRIAATVLLVVASGFVINYFISKGNDIHFQTADNTLDITLPDGSNVALNRNSELSYSSEFGEHDRTVKLKGEAFFNVERDPQKPFVIEVNEALVEVLGTSFNVQGYDARQAVEVVVETGIVKLSIPELKNGIVLNVGERGVFEKKNKALSSATNDNLNFLSWKTRKLVFVENDLRSVVEALNDIYNANIILLTKVPETCVVTVTFDQQSLDAILNVLKTTLNLTYTIKGNQIEITHAGC